MNTVEGLLHRDSKVTKGVCKIMGGKIPDYEVKTILNQGRDEGLLTTKDAARRIHLSEDEFLNEIKTFN